MIGKTYIKRHIQKTKGYSMKRLFFFLGVFIPAFVFAFSAKVEVKYTKDCEFTKSDSKHIVAYADDVFAEIELMDQSDTGSKFMVRAKKVFSDGSEKIFCENVVDVPFGEKVTYTCKKTGTEFSLMVPQDSVTS